MYNQDFNWKSQGNSPSAYYNKSKYSGFDGVYKEHLSSGLISTQKFDFKPFKIEMKENKKENVLIQSLPFFGRSTYETMYPNWGAASAGQKTVVEPNDLQIPLRGHSNYAENFIKYPANHYQQAKPDIHPKANLDFAGKFVSDTSNRTDFKAINLKKNPAFTVEKFNKNDIEKSSLIPAPFPKSNITSTYGNDFTKLKNGKNCLLNEYNKKNQTQNKIEH